MFVLNKDPKEGVEYITGSDGIKRPMSYYKACAEQARKENQPQRGSFFDAISNPPMPF